MKIMKIMKIIKIMKIMKIIKIMKIMKIMKVMKIICKRKNEIMKMVKTLSGDDFSKSSQERTHATTPL